MEEQKTEAIESSQVEKSSDAGQQEQSLAEIGAARRESVLNSGKNMFSSLKSKFSAGKEWLAKKVSTAADYAFAAPEAYQRGKNAVGEVAGNIKNTVGESVEDMKSGASELRSEVGEEIGKGVEYVKGGVRNAKEKVVGGAKAVGEIGLGMGVAAVEGTRNKVNEVVTSAGEKYDELKGRGQAAYENLRSRVSGAKNRFFEFVNAAKEKKLNERIAGQEAKMQEAQAEIRRLMQEKMKIAALRSEYAL